MDRGDWKEFNRVVYALVVAEQDRRRDEGGGIKKGSWPINTLTILRKATYAALLLLMCLPLTGCGVNTSPGEGQKIGQIVRVRKTGVFCKTWDAELIRGGMSNGSGTVGIQPFDFTISSETKAGDIQKYMRDQTEVIITYRQEGVWSLCRSTDGSFLISIEPKVM